MTIKITKKITSYKAKAEEPPTEKESLHEDVPRPEFLTGTTYKVITPQSEHALYITINDITLAGVTHPYEIFINSKNMEQFQWVIALTRVISAVFRKGGNIVFLVEELKAVFDPQGGYYKRGGVFMPSLVAEIGTVIEKHLKTLGILESVPLTEGQKKLIESKNEGSTAGYPASAMLCKQCSVKAVVLMDGCSTCLNCADSKCG